MDSITYTQKQYDAIRNGHNFDTYIVCGFRCGIAEVYKAPSRQSAVLTAYGVDSVQLFQEFSINIF